jgi:hypothetical protein
VAKKKQPKTYVRKGEYALAYTPADEVRLTYNGWAEVKAPEPAPAEVDATADADTTSTSAGRAGKTPAKKAAS